MKVKLISVEIDGHTAMDLKRLMEFLKENRFQYFKDEKKRDE